VANNKPPNYVLIGTESVFYISLTEIMSKQWMRLGGLLPPTVGSLLLFTSILLTFISASLANDPVPAGGEHGTQVADGGGHGAEGEHGEEEGSHRFQVAKLDFEYVNTFFMVAIFALFASIAKICTYIP